MTPKFRSFSAALFAIILAVWGAGCGDRCELCLPTEPSAPNCSYAVTPTSQHFPHQGGAGNVVVTTQSGCQWTAVSNMTWATVTSAGGNNVTYTVQANTGAARTGTLSVANQTVTLTQDAAPTSGPPPRPTPSPSPSPTPAPHPSPTPTPEPSCSYAVQESPQQFTYQGGNGGFSVSASRSNCTWNAVSNVGWIAITGGSSGSGNGSVSYLVAGNGGAARTGTISVAGKTVTVRQSAQ